MANHWTCPKCKSQNEYRPPSNAEQDVVKCRKCGSSFPIKRPTPQPQLVEAEIVESPPVGTQRKRRGLVLGTVVFAAKFFFAHPIAALFGFPAALFLMIVIIVAMLGGLGIIDLPESEPKQVAEARDETANEEPAEENFDGGEVS